MASESATLCIATSTIGKLSETFIRRHVEKLAPGNCVFLISGYVDQPDGKWDLPGAVFCRSEWRKRNRLLLGIVRRMGIDLEALAVRRFLKRHNVRVVLSEFLGSSLRVHQMVKPLGVRFYAHAHGHDVSARLRDPAYRKAYLAYENDPLAGVVTMSQVTVDRLASIGISESKLHLIPYGVEIPEESELARVETTDSTIRCLAVGRMVAKKAPIVLLEAFRQALKRNPSLHLSYVGGGPLYSAVEQFVKVMGLENHVDLHRSLAHGEVLALFQKADIFLQHSRVDPDSGDEEGLPLSILEAMARGVPVVSTRHAGIPEAVIEGECGMLSDENDQKAMAENILRLAEDSELRSRMGLEARKRAASQYSWEREKTQLLELLALPPAE